MQRVTLSEMEYNNILGYFEYKSKWAKVLSEFMVENVKIQELKYAPGEYKNAMTLMQTARKALTRSKARGKSLPIYVKLKKDRVFLIRTDM